MTIKTANQNSRFVDTSNSYSYGNAATTQVIRVSSSAR